MALNLGELFARISLDTGELIKGVAQSKTALEGLNKPLGEIVMGSKSAAEALEGVGAGLKDVAGIITVFTGALAGAAAATAKVGMMASDFNEMTNVIQTAFGPQRAAEIEAWAVKTGDAMGRSSVSIRGMAGSFQAMLGPMMGSKEVAAPMSEAFTQLAIDLGSFWNVADSDAAQKLRSGLTGEAEPLRALGVTMTEASLQAYALANGVKVSVDHMTEAEKVTLRYNFILDHTKDAHGDAAKTGDGFANTLKRVQDMLSDLGTELGQQALPVMKSLLDTFKDMVTATKGIDLTDVFHSVAGAIKEAADWMLTLSIYALKAYDAASGMAMVMRVNQGGGVTAVADHSSAIAGMEKQQRILRGEESIPEAPNKRMEEIYTKEGWAKMSGQQKYNAEKEQTDLDKVFAAEDAKKSLGGIKGKGETEKDADKRQEKMAAFSMKYELEMDAAEKKKADDEKKAMEKSAAIQLKVFEEEDARALKSQENMAALSTKTELEMDAQEKKDADAKKKASEKSAALFLSVYEEDDKKTEAKRRAGVARDAKAGNALMGSIGRADAIGALTGLFSAMAGPGSDAVVGMVSGLASKMAEMTGKAFEALGNAWKATGGEVLNKTLTGPLKGSMDSLAPTFVSLISGLGALAFIVGVLGAPLGTLAFVIGGPLMAAVMALTWGLGIVAGPLLAGAGAAGMALFALSTQTKSFEHFQKALQGAQLSVVNAMEPLWHNLLPLVGVVGIVTGMMAQFLTAMAPGPALFEAAFQGVKVLASTFAVLAHGFAAVSASMIELALLFERDDNRRNDLNNARNNALGMASAADAAYGQIGAITIPAATDAANAFAAMADKANDAAGALSNVPSGYKVALARFDNTADEAGTFYGGSEQGRGGVTNGHGDAVVGGGNITIHNLVVRAENMEQLQQSLVQVAKRQSFLSTGSTLPSAAPFAGRR